MILADGATQQPPAVGSVVGVVVVSSRPLWCRRSRCRCYVESEGVARAAAVVQARKPVLD